MPSYAYGGGILTSQPLQYNEERKRPITKPVIVTGGSGKLGKTVVKELNEHGYWVVNLDTAPPPAGLTAEYHAKVFIQTQLTDFGQVLEAFMGIDDRYTFDGSELSIVHLAAVPAPGRVPDQVAFQNNIISTYNVFEAARKLKIKNIISASSETVLGLPMDPSLPAVLPVTEDSQSPRPESAYSLSKLLGETAADQYVRWVPDMKILSYRFSNVIDVDQYEHWNTDQFQNDHFGRRWNAFGYIDARDAAQAVRKGLEARLTGHHVYIIANADTCFHKPTLDLARAHFAQVSVDSSAFSGIDPKGEFKGVETLLSCAKARKDLGFCPKWSWRNGGQAPWQATAKSE